MPIRVESEIGRLRRVLVHRPGREIDWMVPEMMEDLLFDDILYGSEARREHEGFCEVMRRAGVETLDAEDLLAEVLAETAAREEVLEELGARYALPAGLRARLADLEPAALAAALITGTRAAPAALAHQERFYELPPIPNYFFQRDPQFVVADRVMISSMATAAREREPRLAEILFRRHPALAGAAEVFRVEPGAAPPPGRSALSRPTIEGGDVLVPRRDTLLVGVSERTNRHGIERLAAHLGGGDAGFEHLIFVDLPPKRSFMHLDTVFTFIDHHHCLAYRPVIEPGHAESARVYHIDLRSSELAITLRESLLGALAEIGIELEVVPCGGDDLIDQDREQWTDGANAFALAPGVILLYERNRKTVEELAARGWRVLREVDVLEGGAAVVGEGRTVVTFLGNELSRARGGPRCMTMPLEREPLAGFRPTERREP